MLLLKAICRLLLIFFLLCQLPAHGQVKNAELTIILEPYFRNKPLIPDSMGYITDFGDTISISVFKFYLTNIGFSGTTTTSQHDKNSHLFDLDDTGTYRFTVNNLPAERAENLILTLGVDSIDNTNGANAGDLDPVKGMYWAWNTGYVMAKLEGKSNACHTLHKEFGFHIGGYLPPFNAVRTVCLPLTAPLNPGNGKTTIRLRVDVSKWLSDGLDLSKTNSVLIPGKEACEIADRYSHMFSITANGQ